MGYYNVGSNTLNIAEKSDEEKYVVNISDACEYNSVKSAVCRQVQNQLARRVGAGNDEVMKLIEETMMADAEVRRLIPSDRKRMRKELFNRIRRMDVLSELMDDDSITEIMVNGTDEIYIEREGHIQGSGISFESKDRLFDIVCQIASGVNRNVNILTPILDARLDDGSRVNIVLDPVALNGPILTIRRFPKIPIDGDKLIELGTVTEEVLDFVKLLIKAKYNVLISGGTGSGKTTFLNICSGFIPYDERIITIEDSAELRIMNIRNLVRLETRNATPDGCNEISIRDLIRCALRMRPDRVIVGEVRGEEAVDMLQAFSVGQDGSLSTIHANTAEDALYRLETMIMLSSQIPLEALRRQIASGVDIIIQLGRLRDNSRHLLEIREVIGMKNNEIETSLLYMFEESGERDGKILGNLVKCNTVCNTGKLQRAGIV